MKDSGFHQSRPYQSPQEIGLTPVQGETTGWLIVVCAVAIGATVGGVIEFWIYHDDPRVGTKNGPPLMLAVLAGAIVCGVGLLISNLIAKATWTGLTLSIMSATFVWGLWTGFGGTYADVLGAATVVGIPAGAIGGAIVYRTFKSRRRGYVDEES